MKLCIFFVALLLVVPISDHTAMANKELNLDEIIFEIDGQIGNMNCGPSFAFDLDLLKELPATSFRTSTIWTDGIVEFKGVELKTILNIVDAKGTRIIATALNDYSVEVPVSDAVSGGPILAYAVNGKEISVREKGPLWLVYNFDKDKKYRVERIYARSIWQLKSFTILP